MTYMETLEEIVLWEQMVSRMDKKLAHRINVYEHSEDILSKAQTEFRKLSSIFNKKDIGFLILACLLHGLAKFEIRKMRVMKDKDLAKMNPLHHEEHSMRANRPYYCSREEIINCPVPFDAIILNPLYKTPLMECLKPGFKGTNHRFTALGHDPLLGLVFGTANIMTGTITRSDFRSWHIRTEQHERLKRNGHIAAEMLDTICEPASTVAIFDAVYTRIEKEGKDGWLTLGTALAKETVHLLTDVPSTMSLPIPFVSAISSDFAHRLSLYGINTGTIAEGAIANKVINFIIAFLHRLCMEDGVDEQSYKARTTKIITLASMLATSGDLVLTLYQAYLGDMKSLRKFDLGGYLCTLRKMVSSTRVINQLECEYMHIKFQEELDRPLT